MDGISDNTVITPSALKKMANFDKNFIYEQAVPSNEWVIEHGLNKKPSITVVDSADKVVNTTIKATGAVAGSKLSLSA